MEPEVWSEEKLDHEPHKRPDRPPEPKARLPFSSLWPLLAGVVAGLLLRFVFWGSPGSAFSAMSGAFIYLTPAAVGAITVFIAERQSRRSWGYYALASFLANVFFVLGTLLIMIEGLICAIVIIPMFSALGIVGGLAMGLACRITKRSGNFAFAFMAAPMLTAALGGDPSFIERRDAISRSTYIDAPPAVVWEKLNRVEDIRREEFNASWASRIGVPMPVSGVTVETPEGRVRVSRWDKAVHFDEPITDWEPGRYLRWTYRFTKDSFPPQALDDHVLIGGHYFDLLDTSFSLTPAGQGTHLEIRAHYRISTDFDFYASWVARLLIGNLLETGLGFYKNRSEGAAS